MFWKNIMFFHRKTLIVMLFLLVVENNVYCRNDCWKLYDVEHHMDIMDQLDEQYAEVKNKYNEMAKDNNFDKDMLLELLNKRGKAERAIHAALGDETLIPAGINLGGYCMMRMPKSLLFFHRMKLRNNTVFRIASLTSNLSELTMKTHILLNDLHLFGSYDYTMTLEKPNMLYYTPTLGHVEILLKNVSYKMEGRYRLLKNRLIIELIISEMDLEDILLMFRNKNSSVPIRLQRKNVDVFMTRLKVDLDNWLKDYFNDYLMYYVVAEDAEFEKYNQKKTLALNQYADKAIEKVLQRLDEIKANAIVLPVFDLHSQTVANLSLRNGVLRGLDSMYRRSVATGMKQSNVRFVNTVVGFSNLKVIYRYEALFKFGLPTLTGVLTLTADDLTAHMALSLTKNPEAIDLNFAFLEQSKSESLTIEGPASRMISNFKYMLERHIIAIMTNVLMHSIEMLGTIDRCIPLLVAYKEPGANDIDSNDDRQSLQGSTKQSDETEASYAETGTTNIYQSLPTFYNVTENRSDEIFTSNGDKESSEEDKEQDNEDESSSKAPSQVASLIEYTVADNVTYTPDNKLIGMKRWDKKTKKKLRKKDLRSVSRKLKKKQRKYFVNRN